MRGREDSLGVDTEFVTNPEAEFMLETLLVEVMLGCVHDSLVPVLHNGCLIPDG